jgi:hypothetical protein
MGVVATDAVGRHATSLGVDALRVGAVGRDGVLADDAAGADVEFSDLAVAHLLVLRTLSDYAILLSTTSAMATASATVSVVTQEFTMEFYRLLQR